MNFRNSDTAFAIGAAVGKVAHLVADQFPAVIAEKFFDFMASSKFSIDNGTVLSKIIPRNIFAFGTDITLLELSQNFINNFVEIFFGNARQIFFVEFVCAVCQI